MDNATPQSRTSSATTIVDTEIAELKCESNRPLRMLVKPQADTCISAVIAQHGFWEPYNTALLRLVLDEGDCFIDLGANIGYFSMIAADCVGKTGRVFAFEPEPENFRFCQLNVHINQFRDVVSIHQIAIGDSEQAQTLFRAKENHGAHQLVHHVRDKFDQQGISVSVTSLDTFAETVKGVDMVHVVKMDVQGFETKALLGMRQLIFRNRERLIVLAEFSPTLLNAFDDEDKGLERFYGFLEDQVEAIFLVNQTQPSIKDVGVVRLTMANLRDLAAKLVENTGVNGYDVCSDLLLFFSPEAVDRFMQRTDSGGTC